jgi:hypothetical protein
MSLILRPESPNCNQAIATLGQDNCHRAGEEPPTGRYRRGAIGFGAICRAAIARLRRRAPSWKVDVLAHQRHLAFVNNESCHVDAAAFVMTVTIRSVSDKVKKSENRADFRK